MTELEPPNAPQFKNIAASLAPSHLRQRTWTFKDVFDLFHVWCILYTILYINLSSTVTLLTVCVFISDKHIFIKYKTQYKFKQDNIIE